MKKHWIIYIAIVLLFIIIKSTAFSYELSDENVYFYSGYLISEGYVPYRDFIYAHPPVHVYLLGLLYSIFGFNLVLLKLVPLISVVMTSLIIFKIMLKINKNTAILFTILYLFSFSILDTSTNSIGMHLCVLFMTIGVYLMINGRYSIAGFFLGIAALTRLFALFFIISILVYVFLYKRKQLLQLLISFVLTCVIISLFFIIISDGKFLTYVFFYHFMKESLSANFLLNALYSLQYNPLLYTGLIVYFFVKKSKTFNFIYLTVLFYILALLFLRTTFGYYFLMVYPLLAVLTAFSLTEINVKYLIVFVIIASISFTLVYFIFDRTAYGLPEAVDFVNRNSDNNAIITGDADITPLISLLSGRKIAGNLVDTNQQIFFSGMVDVYDYIDMMKQVDFVFIRKDSGMDVALEIYDFLKTCELKQTFPDKNYPDYPLQVYKC